MTASDRPHRLVLSGVYELPFGRGQLIGRDVNRGVNMLIAGWEYNFIGTIQSGTPVDLPGKSKSSETCRAKTELQPMVQRLRRADYRQRNMLRSSVAIAQHQQHTAHHSIPRWMGSEPDAAAVGHVFE